MKKEDFLVWGDFVFGVLKEFDRRHNFKTDDDIHNFLLKNWRKFTKKKMKSFNRRLDAYLVELLSHVFHVKHFKRIYKQKVKTIGMPIKQEKKINIIKRKKRNK